MAGADGVDLAIAAAQLKAFSRWRGCSRGLPEYTYFHGIDGVGTESAPARPRKRRSRTGDASGSGRDKMSRCTELASSDMTRMGILMSRAAQQMSLSPVVLQASGNGNVPETLSHSHMARCTTTVVDEIPAANNGDPAFKEDQEQVGVGLVLNFSSASAAPSASDLVAIFSRFGPIQEASAKKSTALVLFNKRAHAEEAFAGTAKIRAISGSLMSFRLTR